MEHLENENNDTSLTQEQKRLVEDAKQFISISYFSGNKSVTGKNFDIWKYKVSKLFSEKLKTRVFNDIRNINESNTPTTGNPNNAAPAPCECHDASDFCHNQDYTVFFCSHTFSCEKGSCAVAEDGCGWFWAELAMGSVRNI